MSFAEGRWPTSLPFDGPYVLRTHRRRFVQPRRSVHTDQCGMSDLILYTTEDGRSQIKLRANQQTVWLTQQDMADLFDATKQNISLHLKNIFQDGEMDSAAVVKDSLTTELASSSPSAKIFFRCSEMFCLVASNSSAISNWVSHTVPRSARNCIWLLPSSVV